MILLFRRHHNIILCILSLQAAQTTSLPPREREKTRHPLVNFQFHRRKTFLRRVHVAEYLQKENKSKTCHTQGGHPRHHGRPRHSTHSLTRSLIQTLSEARATSTPYELSTTNAVAWRDWPLVRCGRSRAVYRDMSDLL